MSVLESRYSWDQQHRRRRYQCPHCSCRYTTMEGFVGDISRIIAAQIPD